MAIVGAKTGDRVSYESKHPSPLTAGPTRFVARWDLDKTYLRTDFDTVRDLLRTAIERPDQKRTVPGAASLLRQLGKNGAETHILSGSPEQLRGRIVEKLRLDGVRYASLRLKPNLENILRLRFRALRGQLGYKLPALLIGRIECQHERDPEGRPLGEVLFGDDAESDAFVYSLYADIVAGKIAPEIVERVLLAGGAYEDSARDAVRYASYIAKGSIVSRILIHLERQSSPSDFARFGHRVVPFYNYFQAALVLFEDGRLQADAVVQVATDLIVVYNFSGTSLARSYRDLARRGHVRGQRLDELEQELGLRMAQKRAQAASELVRLIEVMKSETPATPRETGEIDYERLVADHNPRHAKSRRR